MGFELLRRKKGQTKGEKEQKSTNSEKHKNFGDGEKKTKKKKKKSENSVEPGQKREQRVDETGVNEEISSSDFDRVIGWDI